jgi:CBS-domain-containing membrane protein
MLAKDIMSRNVVTVPPEMPVADIADLLLSRKIGAAPVVDREGRLMGIVSEADLMHRFEIGTERQHTWWQELFAGREQQAVEFMKIHGVQASHVMTRDVVTAREDTPLAEVVALFDRFKVGRVPIVQGERLAGMVTRSDVLRLLAALKGRAPADTTDARILAELDKTLHEAAWATVTPVSSAIGFGVKDGIVRLSGTVSSEAEREALVVAAAAISGVRSVQDELAIIPRDISAI